MKSIVIPWLAGTRWRIPASFQIFLPLVLWMMTGCRSAPPPPPQPPLLAQANRAAQVAARQTQLGQWSAAAKQWEYAADQFALLNRRDQEAVARHNLAQALRKLDQPQQARQQLNQAARINQNLGLESQWWRNQIALLQLDYSAADTNALAARFLDLIPRAGEINDPGIHGLFLNELGLWELRAGHADQALAAFNKAQDQLGRVGDGAGTATALANKALVLEVQEEWRAAELHWQSALAKFEALGDPMGVATALAAQGRVLVKQQRNLPQAEDLLRRASRNFELLRAKSALAQTRIWLEEAARLQNNDSPY